MPNQAIGVAITNAMATQIKKSLLSDIVTSIDLAPFTLRMPISLVRCSIIKEERANNPRQAITIARRANALKMRAIRCTSEYILVKLSSRKEYRIGWLTAVSYTHLTLPT